jgi:NitT/TauT family transport system substrate-binding protein
MRSKKISLVWKISVVTVLLVGAVAGAYYYQLHQEKGVSSTKTVKMGYMPVVTNLASPLLDYASKDRKDVQFKAMKFASFAEMGESLRNGKIDVAFIIAPLSIALKQQGEDIKIIYIGNRHESTMVARKGLNIKTLSDLAGHTIAVPIRFSGHNITLRKLLKKQGLEEKVKVVEMNPPDMPIGLASKALDAYFVGEPFPSKTMVSGESERMYYAEELDPNFICNLMIVRNDFIKKDPTTVKMLVQGAVRSGMWAKNHLDKAAQIASEYWGAPLPVVNHAFNTPPNRVLFDRYLPKQEEMQAMADDMVSLSLIKSNNIAGLVDDEFAKNVDFNNISDDIHTIFLK